MSQLQENGLLVNLGHGLPGIRLLPSQLALMTPDEVDHPANQSEDDLGDTGETEPEHGTTDYWVVRGNVQHRIHRTPGS